MGYMMLSAQCYSCGAVFMSNPSRVPSLRLPDETQVVFCRSCVEVANPTRIANGLSPIPTAGAYEAEEVS